LSLSRGRPQMSLVDATERCQRLEAENAGLKQKLAALRKAAAASTRVVKASTRPVPRVGFLPAIATAGGAPHSELELLRQELRASEGARNAEAEEFRLQLCAQQHEIDTLRTQLRTGTEVWVCSSPA
jgi:hypothetical protein